MRDFLRRVLRRRAGQRLSAPPGPGRAQPLFHPAEERRHRRARSCPAPTPRTRTSTTTGRSRSGRRPSGAATCTCASSTGGRWSGGSIVSDFLAALGARRARATMTPCPTRTSRSSRWRRSSCAGSTPGSSRSTACRSRRCAGRSPRSSRSSSPAAARAPAAPRPRRSTTCSAPRTRRCGSATSPTARRSSTRTSPPIPRSRIDRDFGPDDFAAVAASLHVAATREARRLEAEIAIRDAKLHWLRDEPEAARTGDGPGARAGGRTMPRPIARSPSTCSVGTGWRRPSAAARRAAECRPDAQEYWHFLGMLLAAPAILPAQPRRSAARVELDPTTPLRRRELDQVLIRLADAAQPSTDGPASPTTPQKKRAPMRG